jgi:hypothetical protein
VTAADRIDTHEYNGNGTSLLEQQANRLTPLGQNHVWRERDKLRRVFAEAIGITFGPAIVDSHIAADRPTQVRERLLERRVARRPFRIVLGENTKHADEPNTLWLLRARRERPRRQEAT